MLFAFVGLSVLFMYALRDLYVRLGTLQIVIKHLASLMHGIFSRETPLLAVSLMEPCHTCHIVSLSTLHLVLSVPVLMINFFPV